MGRRIAKNHEADPLPLRHRHCTGLGVAALELTLAVLKRGFISFPKLFVEYAGELGLDYEHLGKLLVFLNEIEGLTTVSDFDYLVEANGNIEHYRKVRDRVNEFAELDLVKFEEPILDRRLAFSFMPLLSRLMCIMREAALHQHGVGGMILSHDEVAAAQAVTRSLSFVDRVTNHSKTIRYAESRLGRPISPREIADILDWHDTYRFQDDMVRAVIDEGVNRGVTRFNYLNQIAHSWFESGIVHPPNQEESLPEQREMSSRLAATMRRLGLRRRPTVAEQRLYEKWTSQWGFSEDVIQAACDTTVNIKDPNFAYIDKVLADWLARGVRSTSDLEKLQSQHGPPTRRSRAAPRAATKEPGAKRDDQYYEQFLNRTGR